MKIFLNAKNFNKNTYLTLVYVSLYVVCVIMIKAFCNKSVLQYIIGYIILSGIVALLCYLTYFGTISYNIQCTIHNITTDCSESHNAHGMYHYNIDSLFNVTIHDTLKHNIITAYSCSYYEKQSECSLYKCPHHFYINQVYWCHQTSLSHRWYITHHNVNENDPHAGWIYVFFVPVGILWCGLTLSNIILLIPDTRCNLWFMKKLKEEKDERTEEKGLL